MQESKNKSAGFVLVTFSFTVAMLGTTLPTPLYPLYERIFRIAPVLTTVIYASYALGVAAALIFLGYLSDEVGRKRMMLPALALSAASAATFLVADGLVALLVARVLSGLSAGIATGTATAWLVDLAGKKQEQRATLVAVAANVGGLACGPMLAGMLARYAPLPLRLAYVIDLALLLPACIAALAAPETVETAEKKVRLRIQKMKVPDEAKSVFKRGAIAGMCAFAVAGVFSAVAPGFLSKELHDESTAHAALLVGLFFFSAAMGQLTVPLIAKRVGLAIGCGVLVAGLGFLAAAITVKSTALLFVSAGVSGLGQGLSVGFGLAEINQHIPDNRGETDSGYFVLLYLAVAVPTIGVGLLIHAASMLIAGLVFCGLVAACVLGVLIALLFSRDSDTAAAQH